MGNARFLIADDDPAMLEWLGDILRAQGVDVVEARKGADVLDVLVNQGRIRIVILDVHLPPPSGLRVVALARRAGYRGPFLLITAFPDPSLTRWSAEMGTAVLAKPFSEEQLLDQIRALGGFGGEGEPRPWGHTTP